MASAVGRAVVRAGVLLLVTLVGHVVAWATADQGGGANIGLGLAVFAALFVVALAWAFRDARALGFTPVVVVWAIASVLAAAFQVIGPGVIEGADVAVLASGLVLVMPIIAGMVFVAALIGAAVGTSRGAGSSTDEPSFG